MSVTLNKKSNKKMGISMESTRNLELLVFAEGEKLEYTEKSIEYEQDPTTNTLVGNKCSHHRAIPATQGWP